MKRLLFNAAPHHKLIEGGEVIYGGQEFTVANDRAVELLTSPALNVVEAEGETVDLSDLSREQRARFGIPEAEGEEPGRRAGSKKVAPLASHNDSEMEENNV